jgi:hypothetical protein
MGDCDLVSQLKIPTVSISAVLEPRPRWIERLDPIAIYLGRLWFLGWGYVDDSWALTFGRIQLALIMVFAVVFAVVGLVAGIAALVR